MPPMPAKRTPIFPTTSWTLIQCVQMGSEEDVAKAMEEICHQYWYPLYAFARRSGLAPSDAEDMAQTFFQHVVANDAMQTARPEKGRLRTFLLVLLKRLISKQFRHDVALKRGGPGNVTLSLDELDAEGRYAHEPATMEDPDKLFDRAWAEQVLDRAAHILRDEFVEGNNLPLFEVIQVFLPVVGSESGSYSTIAAKLSMKEGAVRQQVSRMRKRYAALIEEQIAQTVQGEKERAEELQYLMALMGA